VELEIALSPCLGPYGGVYEVLGCGKVMPSPLEGKGLDDRYKYII